MHRKKRPSKAKRLAFDPIVHKLSIFFGDSFYF